MKTPARLGCAIAALIVLGACGTQADEDPSTSAPASSPPPASASPAPPSAATLAACKAYLRVEPMMNKNLKDLEDVDLPIEAIAIFLETDGEKLQSSMVTADGELKTAVDRVAAGYASAAATTRAYKSGALDLSTDLGVVYEGSQAIADRCSEADPGGDYVAIVNSG